jgi:hypothetical protein
VQSRRTPVRSFSDASVDLVDKFLWTSEENALIVSPLLIASLIVAPILTISPTTSSAIVPLSASARELLLGSQCARAPLFSGASLKLAGLVDAWRCSQSRLPPSSNPGSPSWKRRLKVIMKLNLDVVGGGSEGDGPARLRL